VEAVVEGAAGEEEVAVDRTSASVGSKTNRTEVSNLRRRPVEGVEEAVAAPEGIEETINSIYKSQGWILRVGTAGACAASHAVIFINP